MHIYGTFVHTPTRGNLSLLRNTLVTVSDTGVITSITEKTTEDELPPGTHCMSPTQFILPGLVDTHIHAPQVTYSGSGNDVPLMTWYKKYRWKPSKVCHGLIG